MSPWKSASLLLVAVLTLAGCGLGVDQKAREAATPPPSPDPCELVAPTTLADVVGPSLSWSFGGLGLPDKTTANCSWSFGLKTDAVDDVRRPQERQLSIEAQTWKGNPCTEVKPSKRAIQPPGFATKAALDLSVKGGLLTFCSEQRFAKITWWAVDWQDGKTVTIPDEEYEETLLRVGREVLARWDDAKPVKQDYAMPKSSPGPNPPVACELVTARMLGTVGVDAETKNELGTPANGSTQCIWTIKTVGRKPGVPWSRNLDVSIQSYGQDFGHPGTERASTAARQFSYGWQISPESSLGGGGVVFSDDTALGVAARGAFTVSVSLRARNYGWSEQRHDPSDAQHVAWTREVLQEVLKGMPR